MKISLNWLKEYTDIDISIDELVEKIGAQLGAVEEVVDLNKKYQGIVIAKVVSCEKHPNADKLNVCLIDDARKTKGVERTNDGYVQVVCGAPNVREGLVVAWLPPGSTVPSSFDKGPFILEARELRGVVSNGMLASPHELGLSDDHNGILEVDNPGLAFHKDKSVDINDHVAAFQNIEFDRKHKPGDDFAKAFGLDDYIIDVENKMFTHRPDCFGILGVAREIAGIQNRPFVSPKIYSNMPKLRDEDKKALPLKVENKAEKLVHRFMAEVFENVNVGPSPVGIQAKLMRVGLRPINDIVDLTNYFMVLTGQPMHAYDYDKLCKVAGTKTAQLETRMSKKGEKLKLLNGKELTFEDATTVLITSNDVPVGVGGVMGGADTEVDETTKNIVLECANFDMYNIRRTSMKYGLFTDAVTRFNKGQSPFQTAPVLKWAEGEFICSTGGMPGNVVDTHGKLKKQIAVHVRVDFINVRLGLDMKADDMAELLKNVEFEVKVNGPTLVVTPPFWRTDIEIPEDIVEEIGRLYGYDHLPVELPKRSITPAVRNKLYDLKARVRDVLSKAGANEVLTYSFVHGDLLEKVGQDRKHAFELSNAISPDLQYYRTGLTPSLLDKVHMNIKAGFDSFALFELNKVHYKGEFDPDDPKVPNEDNHLGLVVAYDDKSQPAGAAYYHALTYLNQVTGDQKLTLTPLSDFDLNKDEWGKQLTTPYDPKRSAVIVKDKQIWGVVGEFKVSVRRALKLPMYTAGFEVHLDIVSPRSTTYTPISRFPKVQQDISLKVKKDLANAELNSFFSETFSQLNEGKHATVQQIDIFSKDDKTKNVTFRVTVADYERTLTDKEVNKLLDELANKAHKKFGAERI